MDLNCLPPIRLENLPIPADVEPDDSWPASLIDLSGHIGAHATLLMADKFGGLDLYVPAESVGFAATTVIGGEKATALCATYARETLTIPVAAEALRRARRRDVIRAVAARRISLTEAAYVLRTSRRYVIQLMSS